jgi:hypothetical protein
VAAGLTVLRAFVAAGRPGLNRLEPFGRFEAWSGLVRGALVWLGDADPCETRKLIATDDPDRAALAELLTAMHAAGVKEHLTAGAWIARAEQQRGLDNEDGPLYSAVETVAPSMNKQRFGHYLKRNQGRIVAGLRLWERYNARVKVWGYRAVPV